MSDCRICHGELEERRVTRLQAYNGKWYIIENLPALVCRQCGEVYYTPEAHDRVIELITSDEPPARIEQVAVLDAS
ncbi:MAG: YgiT-type zinc finger protein [Chloroflexi bacterium]|nr:MAG: YgiT-type zinc finger protein [Chloroflexota bacterium]